MKIARPALAKALHVFEKEWKGITWLSLKTYALLIVIYLIVSVPVLLMTGYALLSKSPEPISLDQDFIFGQILMNVVLPLLMTWFVSPLYISLSRSVVLGEPFDPFLFKRLNDNRTWRVTKLLWLTIFLLIPLYIISFLVAISGKTPVFIVGLIIILLYLFIYYYVVLRLYYLIPALSVDQHFASRKEAWLSTEGKAWTVFKILLLTTVIFMGVILTFMLLGYCLSLMGSQILMIGSIIILSIIGGMMALFLLPQLIISSIASAYTLSQHSHDT